MLERTVRVGNPLGLHARAAARLVKTAGKFQSSVTLVRADTGVKADAKSILSVLYIAASCGTELNILTDGQDETDAMETLTQLFDEGFGEL